MHICHTWKILVVIDALWLEYTSALFIRVTNLLCMKCIKMLSTEQPSDVTSLVIN